MGICTSCHLALTERHPEWWLWHKCRICGFCEIIPDELSEHDKIMAKVNPFLKYPDVLGPSLIEEGQKLRYKRS